MHHLQMRMLFQTMKNEDTQIRFPTGNEGLFFRNILDVQKHACKNIHPHKKYTQVQIQTHTHTHTHTYLQFQMRTHKTDFPLALGDSMCLTIFGTNLSFMLSMLYNLYLICNTCATSQILDGPQLRVWQLYSRMLFNVFIHRGLHNCTVPTNMTKTGCIESQVWFSHLRSIITIWEGSGCFWLSL